MYSREDAPGVCGRRISRGIRRNFSQSTAFWDAFAASQNLHLIFRRKRGVSEKHVQLLNLASAITEGGKVT